MADTGTPPNMADLGQFNLRIGDEIHLEMFEPSTRYVVRLIGYLPGHSVIVTNPLVEGKPILVKQDRRVMVRFLVNESVCGFLSQVKKPCTQPYPYLHLAWPDEVESLKVRQHRRIATKVIASAEKVGDKAREAGWPKAVMIRDMSPGGARITSEHWLGDKDTELKLAARFTVNGERQTVTLPTVIRSVEDRGRAAGNEERFVYGVQFPNVDHAAGVILISFLFEQLMQSSR